MPTPSLGTILAAIQTEATDAGARFAPTYPPDGPPPGIVAVAWVEYAQWEKLGTEDGLVGGIITVAILKPHQDMKRDIEVLTPFLVSFPEQIHANPTFGTNQDVFRSISARYVSEDWGGVQMLGYHFDIVFDLRYH